MAGNGEDFDVDETLHSIPLDPDSDIDIDNSLYQSGKMLKIQFLHNSQIYLEIFLIHYLEIFLMPNLEIFLMQS